MKKVLAIFILCAMMCAGFALAVSADGSIMWNETFDTQSDNDWIWDSDTTKFFLNEGKLEGWAEAVVQQSNFLVDRGATRIYKECAFKVECAALDDGGNEAEEHGMSIWFADYISPYGDLENKDGAVTYSWGYNFEKKTVSLSLGFDDASESYKPAGYVEDKPFFSAVLPDGEAPVISGAGDSTFTLGMRASGGKVAFFMNDKKYVEIDAPRGAIASTQVGSPILLWNNQLHCTFDNLVVATADYDLFNEGANMNNGGNGNGGNGNGGNGGNAVDTVIVTDTDENGNVVTRVETRPAANNGGAATGGNAAKTGDAVIVALAVMVLALGSAVAVTKLRSR